MSEKYNILDIAKFVITESLSKDIELNITKLHKLLYIVYGTYLVKKEESLSYESPACFEYGPIFRVVQKAYKENSLKLNKESSEIEEIKDKVRGDALLNNIINSVLSHFGKYSAVQLSNWSHRKGSAWYKAEKESDYWGNDIPDSYIKDEFKVFVN